MGLKLPAPVYFLWGWDGYLRRPPKGQKQRNSKGKGAPIEQVSVTGWACLQLFWLVGGNMDDLITILI